MNKEELHSIVSLLIGICVDKGLIKSIDDKILDYYPNYKVKRSKKTIYDITIKQLMTMKTDEQFRNMSYGLLWWIVDSKKMIYSAAISAVDLSPAI